MVQTQKADGLKIIKSMRAGEVLLAVSDVARKADVEHTPGECISFINVLRGELVGRVGAQEFRSPAMTTLYLPRNRRLCYSAPEKDAFVFHIEVAPALCDRAATAGVNFVRLKRLYQDELLPIILRLYRQFREPDELAPLAIEGLTLQLITEAARATAPPRRSLNFWLGRAIRMINVRLPQSPDLSEIAGKVDVHQTHLSRTFKKHMRCTISDYVRQRRIAEACRLIAAGGEDLKKITRKLGFYDSAHFTRSFKAVMGYTPSRFRALISLRDPY